MKIYMKKIVVVLVFSIFMILLVACGNKGIYKIYSEQLDYAFQSPNYVSFWVLKEEDNPKYQNIFKELNQTLNDLDKKFNIQDRGDGVVTDLMKINSKAGISPVEVDEEVIYVIKSAIEVAEETIVDGHALYDITIAPVWQLWDFPSKAYNPLLGPQSIPKDAEITKLLGLVDYRKIIIDEEASTVFLLDSKMGIDLGSIVKGYAADKLKRVLINYGITKGVIDVGRNILLLGSLYNKDDNKIDEPFSVGIVTPFGNTNSEDYGVFGTFKITDETVVTSGSYEKFIRDEQGNDYHHILDPRTGYPFANGVVSITVVTKESIKGDAYSTALFSLGLEKGMTLANSKECFETIWVYENKGKYEVYISEGLEGNFVFNEKLTEINYVYMGVYK